MQKITRNPAFILAIGFAFGVAWMYSTTPKPVTAATANSNDRFSMTTVPVTLVGDIDVVFVLDHLTGVLRGGILNQNGRFAFTYYRNVAADFQLNPSTPDPKFSIVSGNATIQGPGGSQPANGIIYVAELTSGAVVAYTFPVPRGNRAQAAPVDLIRLDAFQFRESAGG